MIVQPKLFFIMGEVSKYLSRWLLLRQAQRSCRSLGCSTIPDGTALRSSGLPRVCRSSYLPESPLSQLPPPATTTLFASFLNKAEVIRGANLHTKPRKTLVIVSSSKPISNFDLYEMTDGLPIIFACCASDFDWPAQTLSKGLTPQ
jgi:hypothetical protein